MTLNVFEACAGIGTHRMGLVKAGVDMTVVGIAENDKHASKSYQAIHGKVKNYGDICDIQVDNLPDIDLLTYTFPYADVLPDGLQTQGGTKHHVLASVETIIRHKRPRYLMMVNVTDLLQPHYHEGFLAWQQTLSDLGYTTESRTYNATDMNVPQNRKRVYCVSTLNNHPIRFPESQPCKKRMKDILETSVSDRYYINEERYYRLLFNRHFDEFVGKITTPMMEDIYEERKPQVIQMATCPSRHRENPQSYRTYDSDGISPALTTMQGGGQTPQIIEKQFIMKHVRPMNDEWLAPASQIRYAVRKLTPKECWRLMGCSDSDFAKAEAVNSETQLYKQAGNAVVVDVLASIYKRIFD